MEGLPEALTSRPTPVSPIRDAAPHTPQKTAAYCRGTRPSSRKARAALLLDMNTRMLLVAEVDCMHDTRRDRQQENSTQDRLSCRQHARSMHST